MPDADFIEEVDDFEVVAVELVGDEREAALGIDGAEWFLVAVVFEWDDHVVLGLDLGEEGFDQGGLQERGVAGGEEAEVGVHGVQSGVDAGEGAAGLELVLGDGQGVVGEVLGIAGGEEDFREQGPVHGQKPVQDGLIADGDERLFGVAHAGAQAARQDDSCDLHERRVDHGPGNGKGRGCTKPGLGCMVGSCGR